MTPQKGPSNLTRFRSPKDLESLGLLGHIRVFEGRCSHGQGHEWNFRLHPESRSRLPDRVAPVTGPRGPADVPEATAGRRCLPESDEFLEAERWVERSMEGKTVGRVFSEAGEAGVHKGSSLLSILSSICMHFDVLFAGLEPLNWIHFTLFRPQLAPAEWDGSFPQPSMIPSEESFKQSSHVSPGFV